MGVMYVTGEGVEQNLKKAVDLFEEACRRGFVEAANSLGRIYKKGGFGIKQNIMNSKPFLDSR